MRYCYGKRTRKCPKGYKAPWNKRSRKIQKKAVQLLNRLQHARTKYTVYEGRSFPAHCEADFAAAKEYFKEAEKTGSYTALHKGMIHSGAARKCAAAGQRRG